MAEQQTAKSKWENFWFYYKWHVVIGAAAVILAVFTIVSMMNRTKYDLTVTLVTGGVLSEDLRSELSEGLAQYAEDLNGDGEVHLELRTYGLISPTNPDEVQQRNALETKLMADLAFPESCVLLIDPALYDSMMDLVEVQPLDTSFAEYPGYGQGYLELDGTGIYQGTYGAGLPKGLRMVFRSYGKSVSEKDQAYIASCKQFAQRLLQSGQAG